uniref:thioredoxin-disulfide reductase (NADPH) n=1 Tax=Plectus sambesii TaxID=2011161 RepID=A0A914XA24_9BILA
MPPVLTNGEAKDALSVAAELTIVVVVSGKDRTDIDKITNIAAAVQQRAEIVSVSEGEAKRIAHVTGRSSFPLVFVKGDCIGGPEEFERLNASGTLEEWLKPHKYDLIVIGGGSGGLAAAKEAARLGKKVACLDYVQPSTQGTTWGLGGTCVNVGCIPKKLMHQTAILGHAIKDAKEYGWEIPEGEIKLSWEKMKTAVQDHIGSLNWGYRVQLREKQVTYLNAYGTFSGSHEVQAKNKKGKVETITADRFLISTGLRPRIPDLPGAKECCISSDDLFSLPYNPGKTLCIGASYVSLECAGFLKGIGLDVTVMVRSILLRGFDQDMAARIGKHMEAEGIRFLRSAIPKSFEKLAEPADGKAGRIGVTFDIVREDGTTETLVEEFETVLIAIGRDAVTDAVQLEKIGVRRAKNGKVVGRHEQSITVPYVYAIGDVLEGCPELTPVAIQAGKVLMRRLYTGNGEMTEYDQIPTTVFTPLEYGCCGLSEEAAFEYYGEENIDVFHNVFLPLEYTVAHRMDADHCYCKLICHNKDDNRVVGYHILTPNAGEVTQGFAIALKLGGRKADFDRLIGIHPTVAENFTTLTILKSEQKELQASGC